LLAIAAFGCGPAEPDVSLPKLSADYVAAFNTKDAAKVASFYTEDGELLGPGAVKFKGRTAIEEGLNVTFQQDSVLELVPAESQATDLFGFDTGTFSVTMPTVVDDSGKPEVFGGQYVIVFKRVGAEWKMAYHVLHLQNVQAQFP
jgi:ketosteroid isomerase-like protein